ncbi:MAG TPA: glycosyltransferase family 4 protein, partial [Anseongella sp.]|nr:glycosyltransferase family 4 protein [Anseongella sp.]
YFTFILNKMNEPDGMEVLLAVPGKRGATLGSGVQESREGAQFKIVELEEYTAWYGKPFFRGLRQLLEREKPGILVTGWPYMMHFFFDPFLLRFLKRNAIKLIYRDIPFNMPPYGQAREYFKKQQVRHEAGDQGRQGGIKAFWSFLLLTEIRRQYLRLADALIFYVDTAYELMGTYGIPRERIFITANSPDTDRLLSTYGRVRQLPALLPPNPQRLIHVGRLVKWKRVDLIIEALKILEERFPQIELLVLGFGPEEEALRRQAAALGLERRVKFTGGVYEEEKLGQYLHESAVYVLAGMGGLSINDAMCFGKPVICSEADGTEKRLVREDFNGKYFASGSAADLARKIAFLLEDPGRLRIFGENSLKIIREELNIHTVLEEYRRAFRYALKSS